MASLPPVMCSTNGEFMPITDFIKDLSVPGAGVNLPCAAQVDKIAWVDKSLAVKALRSVSPLNVKAHLPIVHRPPGFGKTSTISALKLFHGYDESRTPLALDVYGDTQLNANEALLEDQWLYKYHWFCDLPILSFDLAVLDISSPEAFLPSLKEMIFTELKSFLRFRDLLIPGSPLPEELSSVADISLLGETLASVLGGGKKKTIFLCIDNYDYVQNMCAHHDDRFMAILEKHLIFPLACFRRFFEHGVLFGSGCRDENVSNFTMHDPLDIFWHNIATDRSDHPELATTFGFTVMDIRALCEALGVPGCEEDIVGSLKAYRFSPQADEAVYSMTGVLDHLGRMTGRVYRGDM